MIKLKFNLIQIKLLNWTCISNFITPNCKCTTTLKKKEKRKNTLYFSLFTKIWWLDEIESSSCLKVASCLFEVRWDDNALELDNIRQHEKSYKWYFVFLIYGQRWLLINVDFVSLRTKLNRCLIIAKICKASSNLSLVILHATCNS